MEKQPILQLFRPTDKRARTCKQNTPKIIWFKACHDLATFFSLLDFASFFSDFAVAAAIATADCVDNGSGRLVKTYFRRMMPKTSSLPSVFDCSEPVELLSCMRDEEEEP